MKRSLLFVGMVVSIVGCAAHAEGNLVPTLDNELDVCKNRPLQPAWVTNLDQREANKARLIQQIYRAHSMERIVAAGECSCETRFPPWDAAEAVYFDRHATDDRNALRRAIADNRQKANELRQVAMPICEAAGNW